MDGMGKQYNGHTWCKTMTTNIANNFGLKFRKSTCTGHLRCPNSSCEFVYRNSEKVNKTEWTGVALSPFAVRGSSIKVHFGLQGLSYPSYVSSSL